MTSSRCSWVAVLFLLGADVSAQEPKPESIAVIDLKPASPQDAPAAALLTDALVHALAQEQAGPVTALREVKDRIGAQAEARLLGCDDETCVADVSKSLSTDLLVSGRAGVLNGQLLVFLSLIDSRTGAVRARVSKVVGALDDPRRSMSGAAADMQPARPPAVDAANVKQAARALFTPESERGGDHPLRDLRLAVLFDEYDVGGAPAKMRAVETCLQKRLLDADASFVSAAVVSKLKGKASPRKLLEGGVPEDLDGADVDALLLGVIEYKEGAAALGAMSVEADASVQLVRVDSGDVLASEQLASRHPGHTINAAQKAAATRLCEKLAPAFVAALDKRASSGMRVVVEVSGRLSPDDAAALAKKLAALPRVARARLKNVSATKTIVDVVVKSGDGVALALDARGVLDVVEAGPGAVKARL